MIYTIEYTDAENTAMNYIASSANEWIQNAVHERARIAIDEIVKMAIEKFLASGQQIPASKELIVQAAFDNGWLTQQETITPIG